MGFDFNAVAKSTKTKRLIQHARESSDKLIIFNFIEKYREKFYIEAIQENRQIEYEDIKLYNNILEIGENVDRHNNDFIIFLTDGTIFQEFIDTCISAGVQKIINPVWLMNDTAKNSNNIELSIQNLDFTDLCLKGLHLKKLKNVKSERLQLSNIIFDNQKNIEINALSGMRLKSVYGMKDFSFIKYCPSVLFQTAEGYAGIDGYFDVPYYHNLKGMPNCIKKLQLRFGNECLKHYSFSTQYMPESVKEVYIFFNNMNIDNFDFSYLPLPVEDKDPKEYELVIKASQIQGMHRYITSDGSISNGLISQVKKGEKHFEVPSWSVYTHVMDGPNPKFRKRKVKK